LILLLKFNPYGWRDIAENTGLELMISKRNLESFEFYFFMVEGSQLIQG